MDQKIFDNDARNLTHERWHRQILCVEKRRWKRKEGWTALAIIEDFVDTTIQEMMQQFTLYTKKRNERLNAISNVMLLTVSSVTTK